jgi:hypothetical protein
MAAAFAPKMSPEEKKRQQMLDDQAAAQRRAAAAAAEAARRAGQPVPAHAAPVPSYAAPAKPVRPVLAYWASVLTEAFHSRCRNR